MFQNWLKPISIQDIISHKLEAYQMGLKLQIHSDELPELSNTQIALIGIGEKDMLAVRKALYTMSFPWSGINMVDLGNVRKNEISFIIPLVQELLDSKIFPVIVASEPRFIMAQYKAFQSLQRLISLVIVDEMMHFNADSKNKKKYYLNGLLDLQQSRLFHLSMLGCQAHSISPAVLNYLDKRNFDCTRLGKARADLPEVEPIIRNGDLLSFNIAAIKQNEAPAHKNASPSGFDLEEACRICRYAGMSDKLKAFGIYGFRQSLDRKNQTSQAVAQMIWYFIDGFVNRTGDYPASSEGLMEYVVDFKDLEYQLTFWKSTKSGRWWMQVPVKSKDKYQRHRLVPCSYNDYKLAVREELPDRLLNALKRFS